MTRGLGVGAQVVLLALFALGVSPAAAMDAVSLLRRGDAAERRLCYTGEKVIWAGCSGHARSDPDYQRTVRIWHRGPHQTRLEFLRPEGGAARRVIENASGRWFYSSQRRQWRPVSWREPESRLDLLMRNYRVVPGPVAVIAGRRALQVRIEPRFPGNPSKQSWLDLATGIALRSNLYDRSGRLVSYSEFRQFTPQRSLPRNLFLAPAEVAGTELSNGRCKTQPAARSAHGTRVGFRVSDARATLLPAGKRLPFDPALPRYLPRGYVLSRQSRTWVDGTEVVRAHFTDGLNNLSLVQWRGPHAPEDRGRERFWGPGDRIRWSVGPTQAMLAGDLASAELKRIAGSIRAPRTSAGSLITRK